MQMTLRHIADDVRERFARLRMRHHTDGDQSAVRSKRRSKVIQQSSTGSSGDGGIADRTETPDLIRRHVDTDSRTASLPPLPPTPSSASDKPRRRRRTSAYLCPSASAAVMGHIYEEIPPTTPPRQRHHQRSGSTSSCGSAEVGRVYYVSPLDGALCRIFPVDERAVHRRQLACAHVRHQPSINDNRTSSPPVNVVDIAASGLSAVRGRELRLCSTCYRQLRSSLAADETATRDDRRRTDGANSPSLPSSFYNSCDLSLLNVPCCYSSEAGDIDISTSDAPRSCDTDALPATHDIATSNSVSDDVISDDVIDASRMVSTRTPKFGEAGSAFTKFDSGHRARTDEGPATFDEDRCCGSRRRQRPCRVVTDPSFDERRRPLRDADHSMLAILDSAPDVDFRSRYLHLYDHDFRRDVIDGIPGERVNCAKSTSCADVRTARRRSLAVRRRSDDDGRRRRLYPAGPSSRAAMSCRRTSACCSGSEPSLQGRAAVKSVYYNGLLSSMIDLTAAFDRASADDRLSCRATTGPRRSLRPSRQSPSSDRCQRDRFTSAVHHSSGDLMLRSVQ